MSVFGCIEIERGQASSMWGLERYKGHVPFRAPYLIGDPEKKFGRKVNSCFTVAEGLSQRPHFISTTQGNRHRH